MPRPSRKSAEFRLEEAAVRFGSVEALRDISIEIKGGEALALVGPSGAGKTTLLRLLNGTLRPSGGFVLVNRRLLSEYVGRELR
ncbi:MAG: ATP-binding cassette domain-containing protein, partial [Planctomycetota bacterium]